MINNNSLDITFGKVLQSLRRERGLSQEALGYNSGYHRTYISLLERGQKSPSLKTIFKLATALDVKVSSLIKLIERKLED